MDVQLISNQDYAIGLIVGGGAMYASAVLLSRFNAAMWLRVSLGIALLCFVPFLIVYAPETPGWVWLATIVFCGGLGINQVAAPWRVRTGQAA